MGQQGLGLRAEGQAAAGQLAVEERFLTHPVPGQDQPAEPAVPDRQREHAVQAADEIRALLLVEMDQALGVRRRPVAMPLRLQLPAQLQLVVQLAVVGHPDRTVLVRQRLGTAGHVDDREPPMPQRRRPIDVESLAVRAPVPERGRHPLQDAPVGPPSIVADVARDSAHALSVVRCPWSVVRRRHYIISMTPFRRQAEERPTRESPLPS